MNKKAIIIHGWEGSPEEPMIFWLKTKLEKNNFEVIAPQMPNPEEPTINEWIQKIKEISSSPDENTYFIGHSIGCQAILRYLETIENKKIKAAVFIAPWIKLNEEKIKEEGEDVLETAKPWIETPINFEKIKSVLENITCIFSSNDYYVPLEENKEIFEKNLGAKIIIEENKGHFTKDDRVTENQTALKEILSF
ncbi:alpha/beta fold hydrolase [Candidatus Pacearchaeota archaeon]|nr:MAG: alpha/beta fold hydrolase [Candidatus Pacearchaeota archaeon]